MAKGEVDAVFEGVADAAGQAAGEVTQSLAKLSEEAADTQEANLAKLLEQDAKAGKDLEAAGKPGDDPGDPGGPSEPGKPPTYENPGHHDPNGGPNPYNPNKAVLPPDAQAHFKDSVEMDGVRWAKVGTGKNAVYYRYSDTGNNTWHWSGSTNGVSAHGVPMPISMRHVPINVRRM